MIKLSFFIFFFLNFILSNSQVNLTNGLVAYYPFNGNANDASGNNHHGSLINGTTFGSDRSGNPNTSALFDGVDDYIKVTDDGSFSTPNFSIVLWFYTTSNSLQNLIGKRDFLTSAGTGGAQYQMFINYPPFPGVGSNLVGNNSTCTAISSSSYINTIDNLCVNAWNCMIVTFDGSTHKLFLNGVLKRNEVTGFNGFLPCNSELRFGNWWAGGLLSYNGKLDDIRWYNRAINVDEVTALSAGSINCEQIINCNNWLQTPSLGSFVTVGDLDVTGNQITVEANFNRNQPLNNGLYYGHLISKHTGASNVNYALLPNGCEITTTNGYFSTFQTCPPTINKTYHVALVYNGSTLNFFRNGQLLSSQACTGNLITNDLLTTFCQVSSSGSPLNNQVLGFVNEVRIWNVARTPSELKTYMNTSLPNPSTQTGLLGYYVFDNLLNKQGNTAFNGILNGSAGINQINPNCTYQADSCEFIVPNNCANWLGNTVVSISDSTDCAFSKYYFKGLQTPANNAISNWQWSFGDGGIANTQNVSYVYNNANTYNVKLVFSNNSGCKDSVSKAIIINASQTTITPNTSICISKSIQLNATGGISYSWTPTGTLSNPSIANPIASPLVNTTYFLTNTVSLNCIIVDSVKITVNPLPIVSANKSNDLYCSIANAQLSGTGGVNYSWTPVNGLNNPNISNPIASPSNTQNYQVKVTDAQGCSDTASVTVFVGATGNSLFLLPSVFTPNGDGVNDCFGIRHWGNISIQEFSIFNRWGTKVFSTTNPSGCWDGTYKGIKQNNAAFVYQIRASSPCGKIYRKGTIILAQ